MTTPSLSSQLCVLARDPRATDGAFRDALFEAASRLDLLEKALSITKDNFEDCERSLYLQLKALEDHASKAADELEAARHVVSAANYLDANMAHWYLANDRRACEKACNALNAELSTYRAVVEKATEQGEKG